MVTAAIISLGSKSSQWTFDAMKKYFDRVDHLNIKDVEVSFSGDRSEVLYKGERIQRYDCIYAKGSFRYAQLLETITTVLQQGCFMPISAQAFTIGHDKLLTQLALHQAGIPMPTTYMVSTVESAKKLMEKVNFPILLKFPHGTGGKGVIYADSITVAHGILDALSALNQPFIIQEYIETGGRDVRAWVIGGKVVAAYQRVAAPQDIRSNLHSGGVGERIEIDAYAKKLCIKAADAVGAQIVGVDLLLSHKGPLFLEVNVSPGLQLVTETTGLNIADMIAKFLYDSTLKRMQALDKHSSTELLMEFDSERVNPVQEIITSLEFKGNKILLPQLITQLTRFNENADYMFRTNSEYLEIKKFDIRSLEK